MPKLMRDQQHMVLREWRLASGCFLTDGSVKFQMEWVGVREVTFLSL